LKEQQHLTIQLRRTFAEHQQRTPSEQLEQQQQGNLDEHQNLREQQQLEERQYV